MGGLVPRQAPDKLQRSLLQPDSLRLSARLTAAGEPDPRASSPSLRISFYNRKDELWAPRNMAMDSLNLLANRRFRGELGVQYCLVGLMSA